MTDGAAGADVVRPRGREEAAQHADERGVRVAGPPVDRLGHEGRVVPQPVQVTAVVLRTGGGVDEGEDQAQVRPDQLVGRDRVAAQAQLLEEHVVGDLGAARHAARTPSIGMFAYAMPP
jgi:hypothetical protein